MHYRSISAFIAVLSTSTNTASAAPGLGERVVALARIPQAPSASSGSIAAVGTPRSIAAGETFRVYNLSRREVTFGMHQASAAAKEKLVYPQLADREPYRVAPASSIAVPTWMLQGYSPLPAATQTCGPMAYRLTGFLRPQAEARRASFYNVMTAIACENGISPGLFDAMIIQESRYDPGAVSPRKAFGLAQLMPGTAQQLGVNSYDPVQNLRGGARYLRQQLDKFGQVHLALAAYNAGPARIRGAAVPPIPETRDYVATILANWSRLARPSDVERPDVRHPPPHNRAVGIYTF